MELQMEETSYKEKCPSISSYDLTYTKLYLLNNNNNSNGNTFTRFINIER